jgi:hypothetical protein
MVHADLPVTIFLSYTRAYKIQELSTEPEIIKALIRKRELFDWCGIVLIYGSIVNPFNFSNDYLPNNVWKASSVASNLIIKYICD